MLLVGEAGLPKDFARAMAKVNKVLVRAEECNVTGWSWNTSGPNQSQRRAAAQVAGFTLQLAAVL